MKQATFRQAIIEKVFPWLILLLLAVFSYAKFFQTPYIGFEFTNGIVYEIYVRPHHDSLQTGDRLIKVGSTFIDEFNKDLRQTLFDDTEAGQSVALIVERSGKQVTIDWVHPGPDQNQVLQRINGIWWLPYVFWMAGTATLLFIRPKDTKWILLISFNYLTSIWLAAGSGPSHWHIWQSAIVLRSTVWLCLPVYLHLHWIFPQPLGRMPPVVWRIVYLAGITLALLEWFLVLPISTYYGGILLSIIGSIVLLIFHIVLKKDLRRDIGLLALVATFVLIPPLGISVATLSGRTPPAFIQGGAFLAFPALPGAYFFVAYRRQFQQIDQRVKRLTRMYLAVIIGGSITVALLTLANFRGNLSESTLATGIIVSLIAAISAITGFSPFLALPALTGETVSLSPRTGEIEIRANRLLSLYLFAVFVGLILSVGIIISDSLLDFPGETAIIGIGAALLASMITAIGFAPFQRFIDQRILGIQLPPEELLKSYWDRITTSLDHKSLVRLLREELLPSLLVRQSALLQIDAGGMKQFTTLGVMDAQIPNETDISALLSQAGRNPESTTKIPETYSWIRLILPLQVSSKTIGLWLFGRRDPDDFYAQPEISLLETLANQTAIALVNIEQSERLRALHQANVERHEQERANLARDLHDDVLNQLAVLSLKTDQEEAAPTFEEGFQSITARLRQMISGLRPAMLNYGLAPALEELADELSARTEHALSIQTDITSSGARPDSMVEAHLYRIVQQACENALRHAQASSIHIEGRCTPEGVQLRVEDDGIGFSNPNQLDFNLLLADKHYGIAGMFERAALIGAELRFDSAPGRGTRVLINWAPNDLNQKD